MILYLGKPTYFIKKQLKLINELSKVAGYKNLLIYLGINLSWKEKLSIMKTIK
jgi:hypothetical protein